MNVDVISCPDLVTGACCFTGQVVLRDNDIDKEKIDEKNSSFRPSYQVPTQFVQLVQASDAQKYSKIFLCHPHNALCNYNIQLKYQSLEQKDEEDRIRSLYHRCGGDLVGDSYVLVDSRDVDGTRDNILPRERFPYLCSKVKNGGFTILGSPGVYYFTVKCVCEFSNHFSKNNYVNDD